MHGGGHSHHHDTEKPIQGRADRAFAIGTALNTAFVVVELAAGLAVNSVALVADGIHNLGDALGLLMAWGAAALGRLPPTARRTYGWGRSTILAALVNATVLLVATGGIVLEAIKRLITPQPVGAGTVILVAGAGILVNGLTALLFMRGRSGDLNRRAAFLHMAGDAAVSLGVVIAAVVIAFTGWLRLDPIASLAVGVAILASGWSVLRESVNLALDGVPERIERRDVQAFLTAQPEVSEVHDLHIWGLSTTDTALTAHLVIVPQATVGDLRSRLEAEMHERFGIGHMTIQIETEEEAAICRLRPDEVI